jgi:hypothetical protein
VRRCPACGAKTERYAHVCGTCGAALPEIPQPDYGPGVVGASDAETRWAVGGPITLVVGMVVLIALAVLGVVLYFHEAGKTPPTDSTSSTATMQAAATSKTETISEAKAVGIAKEYIDQVDRANTTTTVLPTASITDAWVPVDIEVTSAVLGKPTSLYGPPGFDGPVWTIKMTTNKTTFAVVVVIDAVTGKVVGGIIW